MYRWKRTSRNHRDSCILCQGRVHSIQFKQDTLSFILSNFPSLVRQMARSRCTFGVDVYCTLLATWNRGVDSFIKLDTFTDLSFRLFFDDPDFCRFLEHVPFTILQRLADIDHRKSLMADRTRSGFGWTPLFSVFQRLPKHHPTLNLSVLASDITCSCCVCSGVFQIWLSTMNLPTHCQAVNKMEKAKIIWPYVPLFGSSRVSAFLHILSRQKSVRRNNRLYRAGHGEKSIIWYWEFDVEKLFPSVPNYWLCSGSRILQSEQVHDVGRKKAGQRTRWWERERSQVILMTILLSMNTRGSARPRLTSKARMTTRMFRMTVAITNTMTISRTMGRGNENVEYVLWGLLFRLLFLSSLFSDWLVSNECVCQCRLFLYLSSAHFRLR